MINKSTELLETKTIECPKSFDTFNGHPLKANLKRYRVPYLGKSLFSGMMMYGDNVWAVDFFTENGYKHEGGWCWHENNYSIWRAKVNEDLFNKRIEKDSSLIIPYVGQAKQKQYFPDKTKHYIMLENGETARIGDIVFVNFSYEGYSRYENNQSYHAIYWGSYYHNYNRLKLFFGVSDERYSDNKIRVDISRVINHGKIVSPKEGYQHLGNFGRRVWREANGAKGRVKFNSA